MTFEEEKQLRLHAHLYLKSEVQQLRCEIPKKLRFLFSGPHLKDTMWGKEVDEANWAGAYDCLVSKLGVVLRHGSIQHFRDCPNRPSWILNTVESGKISYEEARADSGMCAGRDSCDGLAELVCWHKQTGKRGSYVTW